jgi:hypothetical protein
MLLPMGCGGTIHFASYLLLLKACESASSTARDHTAAAAWLLAIATLDAFYDGDTTVHPVHFLGLGLIVVGSLLPVAAGQMGLMLSPAFWQKSAVKYCLVSELMVAMYTLLLHQDSFDQVAHESGTTAVKGSISRWSFLSGSVTMCAPSSISLSCAATPPRSLPP